MKQIVHEYIEEHIYAKYKKDRSIVYNNVTEETIRYLSKMEFVSHSNDDIHKLIEKKLGYFTQKGIINPFALANKYNKSPNLFLLNSQAGWFKTLLDKINALNIEVSQYTLYGESDLLIILWCNNNEAIQFLGKFDTSYVDVQHMSIKSVPFYHGFKVDQNYNLNSETDDSNLTHLIKNISDPTLEDEVNKHYESNVIIGTTLQHKKHKILGLSAFIGIIAIGHDLPPGAEVLEYLLKNNVVSSSLIHFFEVDRGPVYDYVLKINCRNMDELDTITDHISFMRIGRTRFEGVTFLVAQEKELVPTPKKQILPLASEFPDLTYIEESAISILNKLGEDSIQKFNKFDSTKQLIFLRTFSDILANYSNNKEWDEVRDKQLYAAIISLGHSIMNDTHDMRLEGAVMEIATTVEGYLKFTLRQIVDYVYDKNYSKAQKELKLSTKDFRKLTLGKIVNAFKEMKIHEDFHFLTETLDDNSLDILETFTDNRNKWAHSAMTGNFPNNYLIDEARKVFIDGIHTLNWIGGVILKKLEPINKDDELIIDPQENSDPRIFLSYSTADKEIADKIANGIKILDFSIWYSDWALKPGDSIVEKINEALSQSDTLIVLLSNTSVNSLWVKREMNTVLMSKLSGQNVKLIPVVIEKCTIPPLLQDTLHIDMSNDFNSGLIKLLGHLQSGC